MQLWFEWFRCVRSLRPACARHRTFVWLCLALLGCSIRSDLLGVTSFVRAGFLREQAYHRLLYFFHSPGLKLVVLTELWIRLALRLFSPVTRKGAIVLIGDGLKVPKAGKKMPAVKCLHQESDNNSKPEFIMGHSFQALGLLVKTPCFRYFCVPLISRIHEGLKWTNRDKRTLLDKFAMLVLEVVGVIKLPIILVVDAYFASRKVILPMLAAGHNLIARVRTTAVAYYPAPKPKKAGKGRPRQYGKKIALRNLWCRLKNFKSAPSPVYGERKVTIRYLSLDLLWRPVGRLVRFVLVDHPHRGRFILMSTSRSVSPIDIIRLYSYRFKIEVGFKQAIHTLGAYAYHFWMLMMRPIRGRSGNQHLHRTNEKYREAVARKMRAYHAYVQLGCIAQGLLQHLAINFRASVWDNFRSWMRTMKPKKASSEMVAAQALRDSLPEFLVINHGRHDLEKMIIDNADVNKIPKITTSEREAV